MSLLVDFRHAARSLARRPGFALLVMATLGLGIGASTAMFSALYRLQFAPLPFENADRLVQVMRTDATRGFMLPPTAGAVTAWQEKGSLLEHVATVVMENLTLIGVGDPVALEGARVSADLFVMLGQGPLLGRVFDEAEAAAGAPVVVLGEALWRTRFGGDPGVVGRSIRLGEDSRTIIGVMPRGFARYAEPFGQPQFWLPYRHTAEDHFVMAYAMLHSGVTTEAADEEITRLAAAFESGPAPQGEWVHRAVRITELLGNSSRAAMPVLLGAVGLLLLIACANVAGLIIVRLNARRRELAIRAALGGGRLRILLHLAAEHLLLGAGAGVIGVLLAAWTVTFVARLAPEAMPLLDSLAIDPAVIAFSIALLLASAFVSGVVPAALILRKDIADALISSGERVTAGSAARSALVTAQIGLSVVLLIGAVLLIRTLADLQRRDVGFDPRDVLAIDLALPVERYSQQARRQFYDDVLSGVSAVPGVHTAAVGDAAPPTIGLIFGGLRVDESSVDTDEISFVSGTSVAAGFLPALGARFVAGGDFRDPATETDVIVNRTFVNTFWPGDTGIGRRIALGGANASWNTIVGVVEDIGGNSHSSAGSDLQVFYPWNAESPAQTLIVRTAGVDPLSVLPGVRQVIARADRDLPVLAAATFEQRMAGVLRRERFYTALLMIFAGLALLLSVTGLYGLVAYAVQQRIREIGIRLALGASPSAIRSYFMAHGMRSVALGIGLGVLGSLAAVRVLRSLIDGIAVYDGIAFSVPVLIIAAAALLASWVPARRALRVDPAITLRTE